MLVVESVYTCDIESFVDLCFDVARHFCDRVDREIRKVH